MPISIMILCGVLMMIAFRKVINNIPIWSIMLLGACLTLLFQEITPLNAIYAIDLDVMLYLFGVFVLCQAAEASGYLEEITDRLFCYAHTGKQALVMVMFALGLSSALLMNDTIAIVGTPIILQLCKKHKHLTKPLLLALAYAVTIGSTLSPIGNPQNLLIAIKGDMANPFMSFINTLAIPTALNLMIAYCFIYGIFRKVLNETIAKPIPRVIEDLHTVTLVKIGLGIMLTLIVIKVIGDQLHFPIRFFYIALLPAVLLFVFSKQRVSLIKAIDWGTLVFFASMFVLMQSVWDSHFFQTLIHQWKLEVTQIPVILFLSVTLSQLISNVPLVALYLPLLVNHPLEHTNLLALAAGSTIAGNLSLLGAASNVIILQNAERRKNKGFGFFEFSCIGIPLTIVNILIYMIFL